MFYLLLLFSLMTLGAGVFLIGFGAPIRETMFGSALIISGTVSVVGGFLLVGLAAAVQELRRIVQGLRRMPGVRPARPADRKEGERRPPPQRAPFPARSAADAPIPAPTSIDEPAFDLPPDIRSDAAAAVEAGLQAEPHGYAEADIRPESRPPERQPGPAWLRRAIAEIESVPPGEAPPPPEPLEPRPGESWHPEEVARRYAPPEAQYGRPGSGPAGPLERPSPQDGRRPRGGLPAAPLAPAAPVEPEDYAPEADVWMRPRIPTSPISAPVARDEPLQDYAAEPEVAPPRRSTPVQPGPSVQPGPPVQPNPARANDGQPTLGGQPNSSPHGQASPAQPEPAPSIFDMVWANDRRRSGPAFPAESRPEPQAYAPRPVERPAPPVAMPAPPVVAPPQRPEPPRPEFARPEPVRPDFIRPEPIRPEPARLEPARIEPARPEPARYEPARYEPARHEPMRAEAARPEPMRQEPMHPEPMRSEPMRQEPMHPEPTRSEPMRQESIRRDPVRQEVVRQEPMRQEPMRQEPVRQEPVRQEPVRQEPVRPQMPRPEPRPLSILKSGVIDEMAYTLFNDGSIEAQMPDGTMRFSSIDELRRHLDQNDG